MIIEHRSFADTNRAAYNPRIDLLPGDPRYQQLDASIEEFGLIQPFVFNKRTGNLVGGHQRMTVLENRGQQGAEMVIVDLDTVAEKKLNAILNRVGGDWDESKLTAVLKDLQLSKVDLGTLGFTPVELSKLLGNSPKRTKRDPDAAAPAKPVIPITQPGDAYTLLSANGQARHVLVCGDSRDNATISRLMDGEKARLIFTDPPYNVAYDNSTRGDGRRPLGTIDNDAMNPEHFTAFLTAIFRNCAAHAADKAALYCFHASATHTLFENALIAAGWREKQQIVWVKHFALSRGDYHYAHEPLIYAARAGQNCEWFGPRTETTLWNMSPDNFKKLTKEAAVAMLLEIRETASVWAEKRDTGATYVHPTQKPIGLAGKALKNSTITNDAVLDPCAGSGSTLIACEQLDRRAFLADVDAGYCDVIVKRYLETFEDATALRNGEPFTIR